MRWILAAVLIAALTVAGAVWIGRPRTLTVSLPPAAAGRAAAADAIGTDRIREHVRKLAGAPSRVSGYEGAERAFETIQTELAGLGVTERETQEFKVAVPLVRSAALIAATGTSGIVTIPLHPLWPNLARTSATGTNGLSGPLVDAGRGRDEDLAGKRLRDAVVVMDWNSKTEWLSVPEFGGRAVIFRANPRADGALAREKFLSVPASIPRYYVEDKDLPLLDALLAAGAPEATIRCRMDWENVVARNILARICGDDTPPGLKDSDKAPVVFHAYYDSMSVVPDLSPGAEQACSPAFLLELARFLKELPQKPDRPIYVLFTGGHGQALAGMTHFVRRLKEGLDGAPREPGPASLTMRMGRPALFVEVDLASHSDRFGVFCFGRFRNYGEWILQPRYSSLGLKLEEFMKTQCPAIDPEQELPCFVNGISPSDGRAWSTYFPYAPAFESELPNLIGIPGITFATVNDSRALVDTPDDRPERVNFDLLNRQIISEPGKRAGLAAFALAVSFWKGPFVTQALDPTLARVRGRVLWLDQRQDYTPNQPLARAVVFFRAHRSEQYLLGTRSPSVALSGPDGTFEFDGLIHSAVSPDFGACRIEAYGLASPDFVAANPAGMKEYERVRTQGGREAPVFDPDGSVIYALDAASRLSRPFGVLPGDQDLNVVVFPCRSITLYGLTDPRGYLPLTDLQILDAATQSPPFQYGLSATDDRTDAGGVNSVTLWTDPTLRVRLAFGLGFGEKRLLLLNNTPEDPMGEGFVLGDLDGVPSMVLQGARDMRNLDGWRLRRLERNGINMPAVRKTEAAGAAALAQAEAALRNADYRTCRDAAGKLWSMESKSYVELISMTNDMIKGVMFYLVLLLPFAYIAERLLFASVTIRRRLTLTALIFAISFGVLVRVHPVFRFTMTPLVVLLAFVILALAVTVMSMLLGRFDRLLMERKQAAGGVHESSRNAGHVAIRALDMGVANIRRRPQRGFLTAMTIVIVTFTLLSFTSIVPAVGTSALRHPAGRPVYRGFLLRERNWSSLAAQAFESVRRTYRRPAGPEAEPGRNRAVAGRAWFYSGWEAQMSQVELIRAGPGSAGGGASGAYFKATALLGLEPAEAAVTGADRALLAGRWFADENEEGILLPARMAGFLGIGPADLGTRVRVYGHELPVLGILDENRFDRLTDLDGEPLTPVNFVMPAQLGGEQTTAAEKADTLEEYRHYPASQVAIVPLGFAVRLGARIRSVAVKLGPSDDPAAAAGEYARRSNQSVVVSDGRTVSLCSSVNTWDFAAAGQIGVPVLLGFLMVLGTMLGSVHERRREIFVYNSVGLSPSHVASLFLAESAVYAVLGAGLGYLLGQLAAKLLMAAGVLAGLSLNYSAGATVLTTVCAMVMVLLSSVYPARQAYLAAMPANARRARAETAGLPTSDTVEFFLPFVAAPENRLAMQAYLHEYLGSIQGLAIGAFTLDDLTCRMDPVAGQPAPTLSFRAWLAPWDLGVSQDTDVRIVYREDLRTHQYQLRLTRRGGDEQNWRRLMPGFTAAMRNQLLMWRILPPEAHERYRQSGRALFGAD